MNKTSKPHLAYRPDIDGLRAIAVLAVVLFHAGVRSMSGGFVGVDVFFVISGYLITSILLRDINRKSFSMITFWEHRIRRILPALLAVIIFCLVAGWFLLLPEDYKGLGQQVFSQGFFASNILFYLQSGYFDSANDTKPLLHTWTLAVEEQFYLFYPIGLFLLWRIMTPVNVRLIILLTFILSFALSIYGVENHPSATFYLLPTRAWELMLGALTAMVRAPDFKKAYMPNLLASLGLTAIALPVFIYESHTPFPGLAALPPCAGTGLLIWVHTHNKSLISRALSLRFIVFTGLISYSWYLWHWPLIVFARYHFFGGISQQTLLACVLISFFIAIASWKFIEQPFRKKHTSQQTRRFKAFGLLGCLLLVAGGALFLHLNKGIESRLPDEVIRLSKAGENRNPHQTACNKPSLERLANGDICQTLDDESPKKFILWGDSHADAIAPLLYQLSREYNKNGYILTYDGCPPILGVEQTNRGADFYCEAFNKKVMGLINQEQIEHIFLVSAWSNWLNNKNVRVMDNRAHESVNDALQSTIDTLRGKNIYMLETVPTFKFEPHRFLALNAKSKNVFPEEYSFPYMRQETIVSTEKLAGNITYINPEEILCKTAGKCYIAKNNKVLYYNGGHLSVDGALFLTPLFRDLFKQM